jgi:hypothetical protein
LPEIKPLGNRTAWGWKHPLLLTIGKYYASIGKKRSCFKTKSGISGFNLWR